MTANNKPKHSRVLIIDDNTDIHQDVRKVMSLPQGGSAPLSDLEADIFDEAGSPAQIIEFEIDSAYQGQEGLEMVKKANKEGKPYAMALVDMRMPPGWDGLETIQHIWEEDPLIEVVICTAFSDQPWEEVIEKASQKDKLLILKKPFDIQEIQQMLRVMTVKWTLARELNRLRKAIKQKKAS